MKQLFAIAALTAALSASAAAQFIIDFAGGAGGNVTYAGGASPLVGTSLTVGKIVGIVTPLNTGTHTVTGGILNFTTGPFVSASGTVLTFGSGGSLTLTGAVPDIPLGGGATLMSASAVSATFDTSTGVVLLNGPDTKNPAVLAFFGIPAGASFNIVGGSIHVQSGNVLDLDIPNAGVPQQFSGCSVTQGGWGAPPHGNNPGAFLAAQFGTSFPSGVTIGGSPFALLFTSALAVRSFLPQGGPPSFLNASAINPTFGTSAGVFAGQVLALDLNVALYHLGSLTLSGTGTSLDGSTVSAVLAAANQALAGGVLPPGFTYSSLNDLIDNLNQSFDGCVQSAFAAAHLH